MNVSAVATVAVVMTGVPPAGVSFVCRPLEPESPCAYTYSSCSALAGRPVMVMFRVVAVSV